MNLDEIKERLGKALRELIAEDVELLERDASERSIGARLSTKMIPLFPDYDVDVEYNLHGLDPKVVDLPAICRGGGRRRIVPDIVVHRRGHDEQNLLAIEIKKETNRESRSCDLAKLEAMKRELKYFSCVLIELPAGPGAAKQSVRLRWL